MSQLVIDNLDDDTNWSVDKTDSPSGIIEIGEYTTSDAGSREMLIAGGLDKSLWIKVNGDEGNFATKTISQDLTGYTEIVLHTVSIYKGLSEYAVTGDFLIIYQVIKH
jgi:hypothetical protein